MCSAQTGVIDSWFGDCLQVPEKELMSKRSLTPRYCTSVVTLPQLSLTRQLAPSVSFRRQSVPSIRRCAGLIFPIGFVIGHRCIFERSISICMSSLHVTPIAATLSFSVSRQKIDISLRRSRLIMPDSPSETTMRCFQHFESLSNTISFSLARRSSAASTLSPSFCRSDLFRYLNDERKENPLQRYQCIYHMFAMQRILDRCSNHPRMLTYM